MSIVTAFSFWAFLSSWAVRLIIFPIAGLLLVTIGRSQASNSTYIIAHAQNSTGFASGSFSVSPVGGTKITWSSNGASGRRESGQIDYAYYGVQATVIRSGKSVVVGQNFPDYSANNNSSGPKQGTFDCGGVHPGEILHVKEIACGELDSFYRPINYLGIYFKVSDFEFTVSIGSAARELGDVNYVDKKNLIGEPVNVSTGAFYENHTDLHVNSPLPIEIKRTYSSLNASVMNEFGFGWLSGYSSYLVPSFDFSTIQAADSDGSVIVFRFQGLINAWAPSVIDNPQISNSSGGAQNLLNSTIVKLSATNYQWRLPDGSLRNYIIRQFPVIALGVNYSRELPYLDSWVDNRGNSLTYSYGLNATGNDYGRIKMIASSNGSSVNLSYDTDARITQAASSDGRTVNYTYSMFGDLLSVQLPDGSLYGYQYSLPTDNSLPHLITQATSPEGRILKNVYDSSGRVVQQLATVDQDHPTYLITNASFDYSVVGKTTVSDAYDNATVYEYADGGQITKITDPLGQTVTQTWYSATDASSGAYINSLQSVTDKRGLVTNYKYDAQGNTIQTQVTGSLTGAGALAQTATITASYDSHNLPTTVSDASGITTSFAYADPTYPYLPTQIITSKAGTSLRTDTFVYTAVGSSKGLLARKVVAAGSSDQAITDYSYGPEGFMIQQIGYTGTADPNVVANFSYNNRGELASASDADGRHTDYTYDGMSRTTSKIIKDENANVLGSWTMTYTGNGELSRTVGARTGTADAVQRFYDGNGRLQDVVVDLSQAQANGGGVSKGSVAITSYGHDFFGNVNFEIDPLDNVTFMNYDAIGQLLSKNTAGLRSESFKYEAGGNVSQYTNPLGGVTKSYYTQTGKLGRQENPDGSVLQWTYYTDGRIQKEVLRNNSYWATVYDDANRIVTRTLTRSDGAILASEIKGFDRRGNLIATTDPEGYSNTTTYDGLNRVKTTTGPGTVTGSAQKTTTFIYGASAKYLTVLNGLLEQVVTTSDARGRPLLSQTLNAANTVIRTSSYAYSADGNAVTVTEGTGVGSVSRTLWTDTLNRPVLTVFADGTFTRNTYDEGGNLLSVSDPLGQTTNYSYNGLNQLSTQTLPDGTLTSFTNDAAGNLLTRAMANGTLALQATYDNAGRKLSEQLNAGASSNRHYSYAYYSPGNSAVGLLQSVTTPRDTVTTTYDDFLRPQAVTTSGAAPAVNGTTLYTYDRRNFLTALSQSSVNAAAGPATQINRTYDGYGHLLTEITTVGGVSYANLTQTWDAAGRRASLNEASSTLSAPLFGYQYRADGLLSQVTAKNQNYLFNYRDNGLEAGRVNPFRSLTVNTRDGKGAVTQQTQTVGGTSFLVEGMVWRANHTLSSYAATRSGTGAWNESRAYAYDSRGQLVREGFSPGAGVGDAFTYVFDGNSPGLGVRLDAKIGAGAPASWQTTATVNSLGQVTADGQNSATGGAPGRLVPASGTAGGADHVDIVVDGSLQGRASYVGSAWAINLDLTAGAHTLTANAVDPSGLYTASASSTFTVTSPNPGQPTGAVGSVFDNEGNVIGRSWAGGVTQTLTWDAFGRLIKVAQRNGSNTGYDWTAIYDGLGRRLKTSQQAVANNLASGSPTVTTSIYDPQVEFLEIGLALNGAKAWKVYGPDLNGVYGGLNGTGGLESTILDADGTTKGVFNDSFGNGVASVSAGAVTWFPTKVGAYGPLPGGAAETLTDITRVAEATAWRSRRIDPTGFYNLGARYYEPTSGRFLSPDPMGHAASMSLYDFANGDPVNQFDPDGRFGKQANSDSSLYFDPTSWLRGPPGSFSDPINGWVYTGWTLDEHMISYTPVPTSAYNINTGESQSWSGPNNGIQSLLTGIEGTPLEAALLGYGVASLANGLTRSAISSLDQSLNWSISSLEMSYQTVRVPQVMINQAAGADWEANLINNQLPKTQTNIQPQITITSNGPSGLNVRLDALGTDAATGSIRLTDGKGSPSAPFTGNQIIVYPELEVYGGTVAGQGKAPYVGGTPIPPTKVDVIYKN